MEPGRFRLDDFELYQLARQYRVKLYRLIKQLPTEEKYCLANQMRRPALSVSNNIAEGHGRWHFQENMRFCRIARGSIGETIDDLNTCCDERYGDTQAITELKEQAYALICKLNGYIAYLRKSQQGKDVQ